MEGVGTHKYETRVTLNSAIPPPYFLYPPFAYCFYHGAVHIFCSQLTLRALIFHYIHICPLPACFFSQRLFNHTQTSMPMDTLVFLCCQFYFRFNISKPSSSHSTQINSVSYITVSLSFYHLPAHQYCAQFRTATHSVILLPSRYCPIFCY